MAPPLLISGYATDRVHRVFCLRVFCLLGFGGAPTAKSLPIFKKKYFGDRLATLPAIRPPPPLKKSVAARLSPSDQLHRPLSSGPKEVIKYYLLSLAASDLLAGCVVAPLSVYPALVHDWVYGSHVCRLMGYVKVTLWASQAYTLMWIGVDRYLAIVKPLRYDTIQTKVGRAGFVGGKLVLRVLQSDQRRSQGEGHGGHGHYLSDPVYTR